jgi:hypothetical protein
VVNKITEDVRELGPANLRAPGKKKIPA